MASLINNDRASGKSSRGYSTFDTVSPADDTALIPSAKLSTRPWLSKLLFSYATPLMELGATRQLQSDDLWTLEPQNRAGAAFDVFVAAYEAQTGPPALWRPLLTVYGLDIALCGTATVFSAACALLAPIVLNLVINSFEAPELDMNNLVWWLGVFFSSRLVDALLSTQMGLHMEVISLRLVVSIKALVFRKVLRRRAKGIQGGEQCADLANLFTSDTSTISMASMYVNNLWVLPIQMVLVVGMLFWVLDVAAFAGLAVIVLSMASSYVVSKYCIRFFMEMMQRRDARMKAIKEVFSAIQTIKFNAWEGKFADKIGELRAAELHSLRVFLVSTTLETFTVWAAPLLVSTASFAVYVLVLRKTLSAAKVFTSIALFNALRTPLQDFPNVIQAGLQAKASLDRIAQYLALPEYNSSNVEADCGEVGGTTAAEIKGGCFSWTDDTTVTPVLRDVNICVKTGEFTVVYGDVGAGKSSLCSALLGEMEKHAGRVFVKGQVAYYSQQPWIQNMTVRENIIFGNDYESDRYQRVLEACGLLADLQELPAGDETEIGHNGVNLSGGQKARVSLARACYSDADVFILDSPLAAVDAVVQSEIFSKCFCSLLEDKTLILVTHNPSVIESEVVDYKIHVAGNTVATSRQQRRQSRREMGTVRFSPAEVGGDEGKPVGDASSGRLIQDEKREEGRVSKEVFWVYFRTLGGFKVCFLVLLAQLLWQGFQIGSDLWLTHWTGEVGSDGNESRASHDLAIYAALAGAGAVMVFVRSVSVVLVGLRGSRHLFDVMTQALLRAPMNFFDANPIGRITNRYGVDISSVDFRMPFMYGGFLADLFATACQLATAVYTINLLGVLILPLGWIYVRVADFYLESSREVNRLRKTVGSPVLTFVSQCEEGLTVIRAFGPKYADRMMRDLYARLDASSRVLFVGSVTEQWYIVRVQLIGCGVVIGIVSALVYLRAVVSAGLVGLAFTYALSVNASLANMVRQWSYVEIVMVSPERIMEYASLEPEGSGQALVVEPTESWPQHGAIQFDRVVFRYKNDGVSVLKELSFTVKSKEKIGIVGRTGAGKSSLTMALFRINELVSGRILIDGVDISTMPLRTLRSRVSIIPQAPVLFRGPLRAYMDPFDVFTDAQIWESLEKVDIKDQVASLDGQLLFELAENGDNFSVGERQLLCMGRALLTRSRIVVMDEATASIDHATEYKLQEMIARDFEDVTVLTIAHRLATVLTSDRVLVMKDGRVAEFDSPKTLARDVNGTFYQLVKEGGYLDVLAG